MEYAIGNIFFCVFLLIMIMNSFKNIPTSYVGIKSSLAVINDKLQTTGFHFKIPFFSKYRITINKNYARRT